MVEESLSQAGTFLLVRRFLKVSKTYEAIHYATLLRRPHWWLIKKTKVLDGVRKRKSAKLSAQRRELLSVLTKRYEGIFYQLFTRVGNQEGFSQHWAEIWRTLQIRALTMRDYQLFSPCLWAIYLMHGEEVEQLKPKFMLRQFVDEIFADTPRTTLRLLAYRGRVALPPAEVDQEASDLLDEAYPSLHEEVLARAEAGDLELLSDSALLSDEIKDFKPPYLKYDEWLFNN